MFRERRLHPATIFFNLFQLLKEFALPIIIGFLTFRGQALLYFSVIIAAVIIIILPISIASWYRFTYRVEDNELRIEQGVFIRKKRYISINRIQSIDLTQSVLHRIFKLVKVQIETASSGNESEGSLKAVTLKEGEQLREQLKNASNVMEDVTVEGDDETIFPTDKISTGRLFLAGTTSGSIGVLIAIAAFFSTQVEQFIPEEFFDETVQWIIGLSLIFMIGSIILLLLLLWLLGIAGTMIKYGNFTITRKEDELFITRGLLEKKQITIPLRRIQAVGIEESLLRQPIGYASVFVEVAGGSSNKGDEFSTVLFPILKKDEIEPFLEKYLPDYKATEEELHSLPKRAIFYYLFRSAILAVIVTGILYYIWPQALWVGFIILLVSLLYGFLQYKDGGYCIHNKRLTIRFRRGIHRRKMRIYHGRIQAVEIRQHKLHHLQQLATIKLSIIGMLGTGTHYTINELENTDVEQIFDWYSYRT